MRGSSRPAHSGALNTRSGLESEVDRMLQSPRLEAGLRAFFSDMLQFDLFDTLAKDAKIYPKWTVNVSKDAEEQTLRTIVDQSWFSTAITVTSSPHAGRF